MTTKIILTVTMLIEAAVIVYQTYIIKDMTKYVNTLNKINEWWKECNEWWKMACKAEQEYSHEMLKMLKKSPADKGMPGESIQGTYKANKNVC